MLTAAYLISNDPLHMLYSDTYVKQFYSFYLIAYVIETHAVEYYKN